MRSRSFNLYERKIELAGKEFMKVKEQLYTAHDLAHHRVNSQ